MQNLIDKWVLDPITKAFKGTTRGGQSVSQHPTGMSDELATSLGFKSYSHGTTYKNGLAPTITLAGGSGLVVRKSKFMPYQMQDGTWRMKVAVLVSFTSGTVSDLNVAGVTWPAAAGPSTGEPGLCGTSDDGANSIQVLAQAGSSVGYIYIRTTSATTGMNVQGDVALASKPTWAY